MGFETQGHHETYTQVGRRINIEDALDIFLTNKQQFALVRDEFGGTSGILTMEDVMETLLGKEIVDELDEVEDMRELARVQAAQTEDE